MPYPFYHVPPGHVPPGLEYGPRAAACPERGLSVYVPAALTASGQPALATCARAPLYVSGDARARASASVGPLNPPKPP